MSQQAEFNKRYGGIASFVGKSQKEYERKRKAVDKETYESSREYRNGLLADPNVPTPERDAISRLGATPITRLITHPHQARETLINHVAQGEGTKLPSKGNHRLQPIETPRGSLDDPSELQGLTSLSPAATTPRTLHPTTSATRRSKAHNTPAIPSKSRADKERSRMASQKHREKKKEAELRLAEECARSKKQVKILLKQQRLLGDLVHEIESKLDPHKTDSASQLRHNLGKILRDYKSKSRKLEKAYHKIEESSSSSEDESESDREGSEESQQDRRTKRKTSKNGARRGIPRRREESSEEDGDSEED